MLLVNVRFSVQVLSPTVWHSTSVVTLFSALICSCDFTYLGGSSLLSRSGIQYISGKIYECTQSTKKITAGIGRDYCAMQYYVAVVMCTECF